VRFRLLHLRIGGTLRGETSDAEMPDQQIRERIYVRFVVKAAMMRVLAARWLMSGMSYFLPFDLSLLEV
jgi:hypothetical protein